jgi:PAS domain-containing protein
MGVRRLAARRRRALGDRSDARHALQDAGEHIGRVVTSLKAENTLLRTLLDNLQDGLAAIDTSWKVLFMNKVGEGLLRSLPAEDPSAWQSQFGLFLPDMVTPFPAKDMPVPRAMNG